MNKRILLDGTEVESFDHAIELIIHTRSPGKWKIIDLETGQEYIGSEVPHGSFAELLREKVKSGKIGSWKKIKWRESK